MLKHIFIIFLLVAFNCNSQLNIDSLWAVWNDTNKLDISRLKAIDKIAKEYYMFSNPDSANFLSLRMYDFAKTAEKKKWMVTALNIQGISYNLKKNYKKALSCFQNALELAEKIEDTIGIVNSLGNVGVIYDFQGDYSKALEYYIRKLELSKIIEDDHEVATALGNIAVVYDLQGKTDIALANYKHALSIFYELGDKPGVATTLSNIGVLYKQKGDLNKALEYYNKALLIEKEIKVNEHGLSFLYYSIGVLYKKQDKLNLAIEFLQKSKKIQEKMNSINNLDYIAINLYEIYKKRRNYKQALSMHELYFNVKDSIKKMEAKQELYKFEINKEYELKKQADSIINIEEKKILEEKRKSDIKEQKTIRNSVIGALVLIAGFSILLYRRFKITKKQNQIIKTQKQQVDKVNQELDLEKNKVELKNKEIVSSINYAKKIQQTILPKKEDMDAFYSDFFVFYQPKDIVGGDFYWFKCFDKLSFIATVDCTGHGVPGGFMSMLGSLLLDSIVSSKNLSPPEILMELNSEVIRVLNQNGGGEIQDGMDIALCVVDKKNMELHFSGARNGITIVSNGKSIVYHADVIPVGGAFSRKSKLLKRDYKLNTIQLAKNDMVFMYTDGYYDQFGGEFGRSIAMDSFQAILEETAELKEEREEFLLEKLTTWKGDLPQIDDVLVMGFKV